MSEVKRRAPTLGLAAACTVVGVLAAFGKFNSMMNFPVVFALVCVLLGLVSLWRARAHGPVAVQLLVLLVGASVAVGGWEYQKRVIRQSQRDAQEAVFASLGGREAPRLVGLEPLNTETQALEAAASLSSKATIISFWATWCSPCWTEMAELEELYQELGPQGLTVLAITKYGKGDDEAGRRASRAKAEEFLRRRELHYPAAITDGREIYPAYQVRSIPSAVLIDENGKLVAYGVGLEGGRSVMAKAAALITEAATPL